MADLPCDSFPDPDSATGPWWRHFFGSPDSFTLGHFPAQTASRAEALSIATLLDLRPGQILGDVPCGAARHLGTWAELGCTALGLDASPMMLHLAVDALASAREVGHAHLVAGLMQALPFRSARFDVILNLFNSFGYLAGADENAAVLREVARSPARASAFRGRGRRAQHLQPADAPHDHDVGLARDWCGVVPR
jgi:SAM-dependent methyltransferase